MYRTITKILFAIFLLCSQMNRASCLFKHLGIESGLSQSTVYAILQDRTGFVWIGTKSGLNRFDGTSFKIYSAHNDSHSLGSDYITSLYEEPSGLIWVGTDNGIWIYNPMSDSFRRFTIKSSNGMMVTNNVNIIKGHKGKIYIAANEQGIFCYDLRSRRLTNYRLPDHPNISGLEISSTGKIWIGFFGGGLWYSDCGLRTMHPFLTADGEMPFKDNIVSSILESSPHQFYIGSDRQGLALIDTNTKSLIPIQSGYNGKSIFVRALAKRNDEIWAASEMGLFVYNTRTYKLQHYEYTPSNPFSLSDNPLYSMFLDKEGGMWIGSYFGGVNYLPTSTPLFERFIPQENTNQGLKGRRVRELAQDRNGEIWVGTEDGGLSSMNSKTGVFSYVAESSSFPNIHGIYADGDQLWVGTFSYGLKVIDINNHRVIESFNASEKKGSLHDNTVFSITKSPKGDLFFGTIRGLCRFNRSSRQFEYIKGVPAILINDVVFDTRGNLWLATQTNGVYLLKKGSRHWLNFRRSNGSGLTTDKILSIFEDSEGQIWLPTQGGGLCRYNAVSGKIERFTLGNTEIGSTVFQVVEDQQGILWFTTYNGLVRYNPQNGNIRKYSNATILLDNQFNYNSSLIANDGKIYLGSLSGLIRFSPKSFQQGLPIPKLVATELNIGNELVTNFSKDTPLAKNIVFTKDISLSYRQNSFSLHVVAINYAHQQRGEMEYILMGYDKEWQPMRSDNIIAYSNLPAGDYRLRVRIKDTDGKWSSQEYQLNIEVRPYFLFSIWAKIFYLFLIFFASWQIWRYMNMRSQRNRQEAMEQLEHKKEQELYESKIQFFTNVAHEIRTPLTLIKGPLENIINSNNVENPEVKDDLDIMYQNTNRLTDLINQLLDFRKTERDGLRLNFVNCNINKIVIGVYDNFRFVMRERNINSTISMQSDNLHAYVDHEGFTKIVSNLIDNAVKYCASRVSVTLSADDNNFTLVVMNDGNIIPENKRMKIFQPFFRLESALHSSTNGTGIGLAMAKSLTDLHGGTLVMDENDTLNVFRLTLPINQDSSISLASTEEAVVETELSDAAKPYTLLLVEDNKQMLDYEKCKLSKKYNIITAEDGEEALLMLNKHEVNLIVSDVMMSPMDGMELCRNVKHDINYSYIPVILLTAVTSDSAKLEGMENGADAYIVKPFSMDYLFETIQNLLIQRENIKKAYTSSPFISLDSVSISTADTAFLHSLKASIERNLDNNDFNVDKLASELNMSRTSLNRKIRGTLNVSPNNYIRIERLKVAARMLKEEQTTINEVCYKVGFTSPSYFTKCFYSQFGLLPKEFNKENK
jgi:ligand-binding sensor domain-containing protein/signal transduction histidine kinase/DNA-binding response OmpR family regulator